MKGLGPVKYEVEVRAEGHTFVSVFWGYKFDRSVWSDTHSGIARSHPSKWFMAALWTSGRITLYYKERDSTKWSCNWETLHSPYLAPACLAPLMIKLQKSAPWNVDTDVAMRMLRK